MSSKSIGPSTVSNWCSPQGCDHRLELQRAGFLGRLRPHLNGSISVQGVTLWLETRRSEPLDDGRRFGASARVGDISEERSFRRGAGDEGKILGRQADTGYQLNRIAAVACGTCHERDLGVVSANERHGDIGRLELIDFRPIVVLPGDVSLVDRFRQPRRFNCFFVSSAIPFPKVVLSWRIAIFWSDQ